MHNFKVGDKVCLITSPEDVMTVCSVFGQRLIECSWTGKEGKTYKHSFRPESLQPVSSEEPIDPAQDDKFLRIQNDDNGDDFP